MDQKEKPMVNGTRNLADEDLTRAVLASFADSKSEWFQQVVQSLVRHLHAFVKDVELTEEEWARGIDFLTRTGHITEIQVILPGAMCAAISVAAGKTYRAGYTHLGEVSISFE